MIPFQEMVFCNIYTKEQGIYMASNITNLEIFRSIALLSKGLAWKLGSLKFNSIGDMIFRQIQQFHFHG